MITTHLHGSVPFHTYGKVEMYKVVNIQMFSKLLNEMIKLDLVEDVFFNFKYIDSDRFEELYQWMVVDGRTFFVLYEGRFIGSVWLTDCNRGAVRVSCFTNRNPLVPQKSIIDYIINLFLSWGLDKTDGLCYNSIVAETRNKALARLLKSIGFSQYDVCQGVIKLFKRR